MLVASWPVRRCNINVSPCRRWTSRANKMNPVAIFVGVLAWGWLWGIWGLLLGVPILVVIKAICDRTEGFKPVGELLGA